MPLIITPGQLNRRAEFYYQLAQLTGAGLTLINALEHLKQNPPTFSYRVHIRNLLDDLKSGYTFAQSLDRQKGWLPAFDVALLHAGEYSGRLDSCFRLLSDHYQDRARLARQMIGDLAYPVFLFHFAIFIFAFVHIFASNDWMGFVWRTFGVLIPLYVIFLALAYAAQGRHGEKWRSWVEHFLRPVPVLGTARHCLALSRLAGALEALLSAGVTVIEAWELAATACGSPSIRRTVMAWRPLVDGGQTPAEVVSSSSRFPALFANQYTSGEISGKLDDTLKRLHQYYQDEGTRKLHYLAQWAPRAVYLMVACGIGFFVIRFYLNYFNMVRNAGGF
jgi:type II secretory pathway component PulF